MKAGESSHVGFATDQKTGLQTFTYRYDTGVVRLDQHGWMFSSKSDSQYVIHPDDPNSAQIDQTATETYAREGQLDVRIEVRQVMSCNESHFNITASIEVYESDEKVFEREWQERIPRDGV